MATSERFNISLNFEANVKNAKQQILDLQNTLSKISLGNLNGSGAANQLREASEAAKELQMHLANAYNADTGKLDLSKFNHSLQASKSNISDLAARLTSIGPDGQKAFVQLAQSIANADRNVVTLNSKINKMMLTLSNTVRWQVASTMVNKVVGAVQTAVGYAEDLNESLNSIRIVSGQSADQMAKFAQQANKAAKALSATTLDYTDAALIYYQQGLSEEEVKARTDVTIKMANAAGESAQIVSDQLTAVWNNFYDGSKSLEYYADVMTKLGAATASSTDEISQGLEKFAAVASTIGLSYEYATAALTTITSNTRESADVVGTALKTIFSRMQDLDLGKTLDDGVTLGKYSQAMAAVGIQVLDAQGQLIDMDNILDQMAAKWENLSKAQQVSLAQSVAGVRQYNQLVALMDNWNKTDADSMVANLGYVENAAGTLQEQADIFEESWEAASNRVQASLQALYSDVIDDKFFIKMLDFLSEGLDSVDALIDGMGGIKPILVGLVGYFASAYANKIGPAFQSIRENLEIVFTGKSKSAQKMAEEAEKAFNNVLSQNDLSREDKQDLEAARQLNEVKRKYSEIENELTPVEKVHYETEISILEAQQEQIKTLMKQEEALDKELEKKKELLKLAEIEAETKKESAEADRKALQTAEQVLIKRQQALTNAQTAQTNAENTTVNSKADLASALKSKKSIIGRRQGAFQEEINRYGVIANKADPNYNAYKGAVTASKDYQNFTTAIENDFEAFLDRLIKEYANIQMGQSASAVQVAGGPNSQIQSITTQLTDLKNNTTGLNTTELVEALSVLRPQLEEATFGLINFEDAYNNLSKVGTKQKPKEAIGGVIDSLIKSINDGKVEVADLEQKLKDFGQTGTLDAWKAHFAEITKAKNEVKVATEAVAQAQAELDRVRNKAKKTEAEEIAAIKKLTEAQEQAGKAYINLTETQSKLGTTQDKVNETVEEFDPSHLMTGAEAIGKITGAIGKTTMAIGSWRSAMSALNNEDLSGFEKTLTIISSLSLAIPTTANAFKELTSGLNGAISILIPLSKSYSGLAIAQQLVNTGITKETAEMTVNSLVKKGYLNDYLKEEALKRLLAIDTAALSTEEKKEAIQKAFSGLMSRKQQANLQKENALIATEIGLTKVLKAVQAGLTGGLASAILTVAGLAAAVAVLGAAVKWLKGVWDNHQAKKPENQLKAAKEEASQLAEELENARTAAEDLASAFNSYETIQETLKKAVKGTQEWNDALKENNEKVLELLELYPRLAKAYSVDENGALVLDENAWRQAIEEYNSAADAKSIQVAAKKFDIVEKQKAANFDEIKQKYGGWTNTYITDDLPKIIEKYGYNYTDANIEEYVKGIIKNSEAGTVQVRESFKTFFLDEEGIRKDLANLTTQESDDQSEAIEHVQAAVTTALTGREGISNEVLPFVKFDKEEYDSAVKRISNEELLSRWLDANPAIQYAEGFAPGALDADGNYKYSLDGGENWETVSKDAMIQGTVAQDYLNSKIAEGQKVSKVVERMSKDELAILNAVNNQSVSNLNLDQLENAEEIWSKIKNDAESIGVTINEDWDWKVLRENFDYETYWKNQAETAKTYAENANSIAATLASGDDLDDEQEAALDKLISKYSYLNDLKEKGGYEYREALRKIAQQEETNHLQALKNTKTELEAKRDSFWEQYQEAIGPGGNAELANDLKDQLEQVMEEITNIDYSIKVNIQADLDSDIDHAFQIGDEYNKISEYLEDGLNISTEKAKQIIADGNGAMLTNCKMTADGMIQLDQGTVDNFVEGKKTEFEAFKEAEKEKLQTKRNIYSKALEKLQDDDGQYFELTQDNMTDDQKIAVIQRIANAQSESIAKEKEIDSVSEATDESSEAAKQKGDEVARAWVDYLNQIGAAASNTNLAIANIGNGDYVFNAVDYEGRKQNKVKGQYTTAADKQADLDYYYGKIIEYQNQQKNTTNIGEKAFLETLITENKNQYDKAYNSIVISGSKEQRTVLIEAIEQYMDEAGDGTSISQAIDALYNASKKSYEERVAALQANIGAIDAAIAAINSAEFNLDNVSDELKEILERYHEINREIQRQQKELDKLATEKDRAFGGNRLAIMDQEIAGYKNLKDQQQQLYDAAEKFLKVDQAKIQTLFGGAAIFGEGNEITNYTALLQNATDDQKEALKQYEETLDTMNDAADKVEETLHNIQDLNYAKLEYELELKIEVDDARLKEVEFLLTRYEDNFYKQLETFMVKAQKGANYKEQLAEYRKHEEELHKLYALTLSGDEENGISQADYIDGLKEVESSYYEQMTSLIELDNEMQEFWGNTLQKATEEVGKYTDQMEQLNGALDHYITIMDLLGRNKDYKTLGAFLGGKAQITRDKLDSQQAYLDVLSERLKEAQQDLAMADDDEAREMLQKNLDAIVSEYASAQDKALSLTEDWITSMKDLVNNNLAAIFADIEESVTSSYGFDDLLENIEMLNARQEEYLTRTNQVYETNKLMRTANKALDETDNKVAKQKLKNFVDETKAMQDQQILSEYELEVQQAKYDLLLAEIALEDAQNAKSTVRLTQDSEGNYGYVYTADQDKVDDAQQGVDDAQNRLYNLSLDGQKDYTEKRAKLMQEANQALSDLQKEYEEDTTMTKEEYEAKRLQLTEYYYQQLMTYENLFAFAASVSTEAQQDYWVKGYENILVSSKEWKETIEDHYDEIDEQIETWRDVQETANEDVSGALDDSKTATELLTDASKDLKEQLVGRDGVIDAIDEETEKVRLQTLAYSDQREELLDLIDTYYEYTKAVRSTINNSSSKEGTEDHGSTDFSREMIEAYMRGDKNAIVSLAVERQDKIDAEPGSSDVDSQRLINLFNAAMADNPGPKAVQLIKDVYNKKKYFTDATVSEAGFATGGYTGDWGTSGKLAFLHEKELVLNAEDTKNILSTVTLVRQIASMIDSQAAAASLFNLSSSGIASNSQTLEQSVTIHAEFPNATDHNEIEEAFSNLINRASQFANRK